MIAWLILFFVFDLAGWHHYFTKLHSCMQFTWRYCEMQLDWKSLNVTWSYYEIQLNWKSLNIYTKLLWNATRLEAFECLESGLPKKTARLFFKLCPTPEDLQSLSTKKIFKTLKQVIISEETIVTIKKFSGSDFLVSCCYFTLYCYVIVVVVIIMLLLLNLKLMQMSFWICYGLINS